MDRDGKIFLFRDNRVKNKGGSEMMKGQLSAEMIILIAVVLAVVAIVAISLTKNVEKTGESVENKSERIIERTDQITNNFSAQITTIAESPQHLFVG